MADTGRALWAHSANDDGVRQPLVDHLAGVAALAGRFAEPFGLQRLAAAAGALHDLGKASQAFQRYLRECEEAPELPHPRTGHEHKGAGAVFAVRRHLDLLALVIQGHHGGLQDRAEAQTWLAERASDPRVTELLAGLPPELCTLVDAETTAHVPHLHDRLSGEFLIRMVFACLVDADSLDTEAHFRPRMARLRARPPRSMEELANALDAHLAAIQRRALHTPVNELRAEIAAQCVAAANRRPGLYRLAVPTGGGKTLAGMAFALHHAARHDLGRVIVAVPFTSITEQTADVYRRVFGSESVLEHHSAVAPHRDDGETRGELWSRLAAENWDAPLVVTTTVQLLESLFTNRRSAARKLHRIARSVVIIDEAQAIPPTLSEPVFRALRRLCEEYGATVVLSTATQPTADVPELAWLERAEDIVPTAERLFERLRRVRWSIDLERWPPDRVGRRLADEQQALAIMNTRREALSVLDAAPQGTLHLSTLLCGEHRRQVLAQVRLRLREGEACRLVSTQVIEAGVDVDFPTVLRALAPLDSLTQAAGRCNREGRQPRGEMLVFGGDQHPRGSYRTGTDLTRALLAAGHSIEALGTIERYFRALYRNSDTDLYHVRAYQQQLAFRTVAQEFRMIRDDQVSVAIPFDDTARAAIAAVASLFAAEPGEARRRVRDLQPYLVNLRPSEVERATKRGWIDAAGEVPVWTGPYSGITGVGEMLCAGGDHGSDEPATA